LKESVMVWLEVLANETSTEWGDDFMTCIWPYLNAVELTWMQPQSLWAS
jgi:hypothetical protein